MDASGSTTLNVTSTSQNVTIPAGSFRIFGNQMGNTLTNEITPELATLRMFPNPAQESFYLNKPVQEVTIHDITGKLIRTFKGNFNSNHRFDVSGISTGLYIVTLEGDLGAVSKRLVIY